MPDLLMELISKVGVIPKLNDLDVDDLENLTNAVDSSCIVTGGVVSEGTNAGTFKVSAITEAYLRTSASATAPLVSVTLAEQDNQTITTADTTYFVVFTYGTPCTITLSETAPNGYNAIPLGKVMKDGSDNVHYIDGGFRFGDGVRKLHQRAKTLRALELESGSAIEYSGTTNSNTIDYAHYDDGDGTLGNVGVSRYGVHYVYRHVTVPDHLADFGCQIGAIIAPQAGGSFTSVIMVTSQFFSGTEVVSHNNLGGLQGGTTDEYYHLTATEHTNNAYTTDKLSDFASTTSAELADTISDEEGTGKLVYNTAPTIYSRVTTKTGTCTLTVDEAGVVLVSASSDYTITLPTAVGNTGLTYKFKKTDANYNCITLDGDGSETINYENADGVPKLTYSRLNTYGAEVTLVSDGSNWQAYDEAMGQVPECYVSLSANQENLIDNTTLRVEFDTEISDIGSNYDMSEWVSGNATSTLANHLVDTNGAFTPAMVGVRVKNTTDSTYAYITAYNSATDVTVSPDIFVDTEGYQIMNSKFVAPINGRYQYIYNVLWANLTVIADKKYGARINKNSGASFTGYHVAHASNTSDISNVATGYISLNKDDYIDLVVQPKPGADTVDIRGTQPHFTSMEIKLISKD